MAGVGDRSGVVGQGPGCAGGIEDHVTIARLGLYANHYPAYINNGLCDIGPVHGSAYGPCPGTPGFSAPGPSPAEWIMIEDHPTEAAVDKVTLHRTRSWSSSTQVRDTPREGPRPKD
jgi:hypothetical protein